MRRLPLLFALVFGFLNLGFGPPAVVDVTEASVPLYPSQTRQVGDIRPPAVGAEAYAVLEHLTGRLIVGKNAHRRLAPASTTKIASAVVALERGRLDETVQVEVDSRELADSSVMGLLPGEMLTLRDLLYGLLLPSGNDAAIAIARHVGGSEERFVAMMNDKAAALGLRDTHFVNPHGLDHPDHYASAYDLAMLARYAMNNPTFAAIVSTREYAAVGTLRRYDMRNTNPLLFAEAGVDGVKTGYTERAKQALVTSAVRNGQRVLVAVLRSDDRVADTVPLLNHFFANYSCGDLELPRNSLNAVGTVDGRGRHIGPLPVPRVCLPNWQWPFVRSTVWLDDEVPPAWGDEARLGFVGFYLGGRLLAEAPVYGR